MSQAHPEDRYVDSILNDLQTASHILYIGLREVVISIDSFKCKTLLLYQLPVSLDPAR
jgi:hypothetical protein